MAIASQVRGASARVYRCRCVDWRIAVGRLSGLAGACFLTRTAGIAVVAVGFAWLLMNGRRVGAVIFRSGHRKPGRLVGALGPVSYRCRRGPLLFGVDLRIVERRIRYAWHEKLAVIAANATYSIFTPLAFWASMAPCGWLPQLRCWPHAYAAESGSRGHTPLPSS
jgi:hypothetical protein